MNRHVLGSWRLMANKPFPFPDYIFVTPVEVDSSGSYITHDVLRSARRKRSTVSSKSSLHYKFSAFGQELLLDLQLSAFFGNGFTVQVLGEDGIVHSQEHEVEQCFYQGFIRNYSSSSVAISTCVGLVSVCCPLKCNLASSPCPLLPWLVPRTPLGNSGILNLLKRMQVGWTHFDTVIMSLQHSVWHTILLPTPHPHYLSCQCNHIQQESYNYRWDLSLLN